MGYRVVKVDGTWCVVAVVSREASQEAAEAALLEFAALGRASGRVRQAARELSPERMKSFLGRLPEKGKRTPESIEAWLRSLPSSSKH
ncbi:hypothetical protein SS37A_38910 (plasmid) [Methylocystis iwaonis]|uniref:Uncharacterized protein n=1 Tax=Methylocystis iwaonis TaxID=2885079 RepID=A0ABM8EEA0_9HYPH|nr:hypothetical protein SS37A_38910 [Methylocystis iwaonis]